MNKSVRVIAAALVCAAAASATDWQQYEVYLGYTFVRFNPNSDFIPSFNANGGGGQFAYNFNRWFSGVVDLAGVNKGTLGGFNVDTTVASFTAGPRFSWHKGSKWVPYGQVLFGGAYATTSTQLFVIPSELPTAVLPPGFIVPPGLSVSTRLGASTTGFAMLAGGGLDIKLSRHVAFRPFEVDYFLTRIPNGEIGGSNTNRNNFRYTGGVTFMFGGPR